MKLVDLVKVSRLDSLIRRAATGTPEKLAERLEISRSSLFELIAFLKEEMGAPIIYNRYRQSYIYSYTPRFFLDFERERLSEEKMTDTYGFRELIEKDDNRSKNKIKIEIEIDSDDYILDDDIDFNNLYH